MFQPETVRGDFPILNSTVNGKPLIYLDNAATTQVPLRVLDRLRDHYLLDNANVHRGIHTLSERSTQAFEDARETVRRYLNAACAEEIIFTSGATDSINRVAQGLHELVGPGDSVLVTQLEHHSDFLPWQRLCAETGATFTVVPCPGGELTAEAFETALRRGRPTLAAVTQVSNVTGTAPKLNVLAELAHAAGAMLLVDGAQGARHECSDVAALGCDFYCFSGHKLLAPTGIGVLWGRKTCLERLRPTQVGGGMVDTVTVDRATYGPLPGRLEAGTPNYAGAIALAESLRYLEDLGREAVSDYEHGLVAYAENALSEIDGLTILGHPARRAGVLSFTLDGIHPYDAASVLDKLGVALRSGTHCAQPALQSFGLESVLRLSPAFYNTREEVDRTCVAIRRTEELLKKWTRN